MPVPPDQHLSKRESQAMEVIYRLGKASAADVQQQMVDAPNYSAVRSLLTILTEKGLIKHSRDQRRYVYEPAKPAAKVRKQALSRLITTFFDGSTKNLVASLLDPREANLSADDLAALRQLLDEHPKS